MQFDFSAPTPLAYFATLVQRDDGLPLLEAAASLGQDDHPALDVQQVLHDVDQLAARLQRRVKPDDDAMERLRALNQFFFGDLGFAGNVNDYYNPDNSFLHAVLHTRRGIPISLAVLWLELAQGLGLQAEGVGFPGHFLVQVNLNEGRVVIDPFTGQSLSRDELDERLLPYRRQRGLTGDFEAPLGLFLQAAPPRDVIARLLRNLKEIHRTGEDWTRLLPVLERLVVLLPEAWEEHRDRGLARAELGLFDGAAADLRCYLEHRPQADDAPALLRRLAELRDSGSPRWH